MLETLSKKETVQSIEALSKLDKDEWKAIAVTATQLNSFISLGDTTGFLSTMTTSVKKTIDLQIASVMAPIQNEINQTITNVLNPLLELLTPIINELSTFLAENQTGAGVGGIAGTLIGSIWGPAGASAGGMVGAIVGAVVEAITRWTEGVVEDLASLSPSGAPLDPDVRAQYEAETGNTFTSIFNWDYINWFQNRSLPTPDYHDPDDYREGR